MLREGTLEDFSDGKLYTKDDLVKANCHGCEGCSDCCHGMGNTVVLDPYDIYRMTVLRGTDFQTLMAEGITLGMVDGLILPSLKMSGEREACYYLDADGRCSIHEYRPGICRLFPLGRYYEGDKMGYFLQTGECSHSSRSKIKVKQWVDTPELGRNEQFEIAWHLLLKNTRNLLYGQPDAENDSVDNEPAEKADLHKEVCMKLLNLFYVAPYNSEEPFYDQIEKRMQIWKQEI